MRISDWSSDVCSSDLDAEKSRQTLAQPLICPVERRRLRVRIDDQNTPATGAPGARQMQGERRLSNAALLVEEGDDHRALRSARCKPCGAANCVRKNQIGRASCRESGCQNV